MTAEVARGTNGRRGGTQEWREAVLMSDNLMTRHEVSHPLLDQKSAKTRRVSECQTKGKATYLTPTSPYHRASCTRYEML